MQRFILCHYHEIALKKKNRAYFEGLLCRNIERALEGLPFGSVHRLFGRLVVQLRSDSPVEEIVARLENVFGIASYSPAWACPAELEAMKGALWELVSRRSGFETFKIHSRRADKKFPMDSPYMNEQLGALIREKTGKRVQLRDPDLTCYVHVVDRRAFLYFDRLAGPGGLPVSSAGKVVVLISGGIDSPVAAYKMIRRGCRVVFAHFHSFPHTTSESQEKVRELVSELSRYQFRSVLYLVPFAEAQRRIVALTPPETRVILYRRLMLRAAQRIARRERAKALVTGDSIGQVASQTLDNLAVVSSVARLPVFQPLIGDDKEEIVALARRIGTYEISIRPDQDCCSLFVPKHPETRARLSAIQEIEKSLDGQAILRDMQQRAVVEKLAAPPGTVARASCP